MFTDEEKKILSQYVTSTEDNVFAVKNLQGMTGAAYARYSRAKGGFREVLLKEFIAEGAVDPKHADELIARLGSMAKQLPDEADDVRRRAQADGLDKAVIDRLAMRLIERAGACQRALNGK